jgi:hypothetical protein
MVPVERELSTPERTQWDPIERLRAHREAEVRVRQFLRMLGASLDGTTTTG